MVAWSRQRNTKMRHYSKDVALNNMEGLEEVKVLTVDASVCAAL